MLRRELPSFVQAFINGQRATVIDFAPSLFPVFVASTFRTMSYPGPPPTIPGVDQSYVDKARVHACLASVTFLVVLPLGVLIPRYFRTFTTKSVIPRSSAGVFFPILIPTVLRWWLAHWVLNGFVSFPLIIISWVKGVNASGNGPMDHHQVSKFCFVVGPIYDSVCRVQKIGTIIFTLYIVQIFLGAFVHFIRIPFPLIVHRPLSNYVHALLGLTIIVMSAYQVRR